MKRYVYGIDCGLDGGITIMLNRRVLKAFPMPTVGKGKDRTYDLRKLRRIFITAKRRKKHADVLIMVEKQAAHKITGKVALFKLATGFGELRGMCAAFKLSLIEIPPNEWMQKILKGRKKKSEKDKPSVPYIQKRFPDVPLTFGPRAKKPHNGVTDSMCIALAGFME